MADGIPPIPKTLALYDNFKWPSGVPQDKQFSEMTPEQQARYRAAVRFGGFRPGIYQGITGSFPWGTLPN